MSKADRFLAQVKGNLWSSKEDYYPEHPDYRLFLNDQGEFYIRTKPLNEYEDVEITSYNGLKYEPRAYFVQDGSGYLHTSANVPVGNWYTEVYSFDQVKHIFYEDGWRYWKVNVYEDGEEGVDEED